jgi:hypothetical protein
MSGFHFQPCREPDGLLKTAAHSVAFNRISLAFGNREANPGFGFRLFAIQNLHQESPASPFFSCLDSKKLRSVFQPTGYFLLMRHVPRLSSGYGRLGRETGAAACAASSQNLATAGSCHAGAETMTTLANKLGWLESTLRHLFNTAGCGPS